MPTWQKKLTKAIHSRRKFGSDGNESQTYGQEAIDFFNKKSNIDKILAVGLEWFFWVGKK